MAIKETNFTLDLTREGKYPVVKFRLNDNKVQKITFRLTNDGRDVDLEKEMGDQFKPVFECIFRDKTFKRDENKKNWEIKREGKIYTFTYYLTNEVIDQSGIACYYFALETPEGLRISTPTLKMVIDCDFKEDGKPSDNYVSDFEKLWEEAKKIKDRIDYMEEEFQKVIEEGGVTPEVIDARDGEKTLKDRLNRDYKDFESLKAEVSFLQQPAISEVVMKMFSGEKVVIDCYGDSTYYGLKVGGGRVDIPAPAQLQEVLRSYYKNVSITVNNRGISGNQTTNALRTFEDEIKKSEALIVYMNYGLNDMSGANPSGVNDPKITAEQYRKNLRKMVSIVRKYNKIAILEGCNLQLVTHAGNDKAFRMEGTQQFARTMKQVAEEMNVPYVDQQKLTSKYMSGRWNVPESLPDGLHPSQELYLQKGQNMAIPIIHPTHDAIVSETLIPAGSPGFQGTDVKSDTSINIGSKSGAFMFSQNSVRAAVLIEESGLDVYISTIHWSGGSPKCEVSIDCKSVGVISLRDESWVTPNYLVDSEIMVLENANPGLHYIELSNLDTTGSVGWYYIRTRKTKKKYEKATGGNIYQKDLVVSNLTITANEDNDTVHYMLDIPTSRFLKEIRLSMTATLDKGDGIVLFARNRGNDAEPHGGLYLYTETTGGTLRIAEGDGKSGYINQKILTQESVHGKRNEYSILVSTKGECSFYLNGTLVGNHTIKDTHIGGFLGFWKNTKGSTVIESVHMN